MSGEKPPLWDPGRWRGGKINAILRLIRVEHTLFSLPFAYAGAVLAGCPLTWRTAVLIGLALFGLRTAGMAYNNIADLEIDRLNPRSRMRPLVTGAVSVGEAYAVVAAGSILYYLSAWLLNKYALLFSPLLWIAAITYPYAKRIHWMPHLHLGLVLGLAVFGGAVAVCGCNAPSASWVLARVPWVYVAAVTLWVAGFDIVYSIMDYEFDRSHGLGSAAARLGVEGAAWFALAIHVVASALFVLGALLYRPLTGGLTLVSAVIGSALMLYADARVIRDKRWIPKAFNLNLIIGLIVSLGVIADYILKIILG